jgi:hypothetical protein
LVEGVALLTVQSLILRQRDGKSCPGHALMAGGDTALTFGAQNL